MTLPSERTKAVLEAGNFLRRLCDPKVTPGLPKTIRQASRALLRHYPTAGDLHLTYAGWNDKMLAFTLVDCPFGDPDEF